jgi:ubiquitin-protein ligase
MTPQRLQQEIAILEKFFPKKYKFENLYLENELLDVGVKTQSGKVYRLNILLPNDYPNSLPKVYIVFPLPLKKADGSIITGLSHSFHTLENDGDKIQICHYKPNAWKPTHTLYRIIMKARIWLEAYEGHLATGNPIDNYLTS